MFSEFPQIHVKRRVVDRLASLICLYVRLCAAMGVHPVHGVPHLDSP